MAPLYPIQPTFARGEISPRLWSRADIPHWKMALKECLNWIILKQGGLRRRPGTEYIVEIKDSTRKVRLVKFIFSTTQAYVLEIGHQYIRFFANGGQVMDGPDPLEITSPYTEDDLFELQFAQSADVLYIAHPDYAPRKLERHAADDFTLVAFEYKDGPYRPRNTTKTLLMPSGLSGNIVLRAVRDNIPVMTSPTTEGVAITCNRNGVAGHDPWMLADKDSTSWFQVDGSQNFILTVDFGSGNQKTITFYQLSAVSQESDSSVSDVFKQSPANWTLLGSNDGSVFTTLDTQTAQKWTSGEGKTYAIGSPAAYRYYRLTVTNNQNNNDETRLAEFNLLTETALAINGDAGFGSGDVGRHFNLEYGDKNYWGKITSIINTTRVNATMQEATTSNGATGGWRLGAWSDGIGYPACVTFFQQRLVWARTNLEPQTLWFSRSGVFDDYGFNSPAADDDGITLTILSGQADAITWIAEGKDLLIGTTGAARTVGPSDSSQPFSATNLIQRRHTTYGSKMMQPLQIGAVAIYATYYGRSLREFLFSFQIDAYQAPELSVLGEHMLRSGIQQMDFQQDEDAIIWAAMGNGELVGITYDRDQEIVAMHRHRLGGSCGDDEFGHVESVCCIPGETQTELWLVVRRDIDGTSKRYVEKMTFPFEGEDVEDAFFVDSGDTYEGVPANTISAATWLEGEEVSILADGRVEKEKDVDGGSFTITGTAAKITFGLPYVSRMHTLPIAQGYGDGSGIGRRKRVVEAIADLLETGYLEGGSPSIQRFDEVFHRKVQDLMAAKVELRDGTFKTKFDSSWTDAGEVVLQTDKPLPATIRSITPVFEGEP